VTKHIFVTGGVVSPIDALVSPLPSELTTPPVTKMCFVTRCELLPVCPGWSTSAASAAFRAWIEPDNLHSVKSVAESPRVINPAVSMPATPGQLRPRLRDARIRILVSTSADPRLLLSLRPSPMTRGEGVFLG
jgi:hypothetical protein